MKFGIQPDKSGFVWLHRFIDLLVPTLALISITYLLNIPLHDRYLVMSILGGIALLLLAQFVGVYSAWRGRTLFSSFKLIIQAWLLTWSAMIIIAFLFKDADNFSRLAIGIWLVITPIILLGYRFIIRTALSSYRAQGNNSKTILIVGAGKVGIQISETITNNKWLGYRVVGFIDDNHSTATNTINILGNTSEVTQIVNTLKIDEVYLCLPLRSELKIREILDGLTDTTAIVKFVPDLFSFDLMHAKWTELQGIPLISVYDSPLTTGTSKFLKRVEDLSIATLILFFISPVLLWVAYKIKISSPGPIIFKQKRYGLNGKEIEIYKFRSMTTQDNGSIVKQATKGDARITSFGEFIRRTSLDELPQFVNVLQGRMSIVGPRPHAVAHNEEYRKLVPKYMQRHLVKPGITGWAQINGWRGETDTLDKMVSRIEFDLHYINNWTLLMDIKIIGLTVFKGFINKNAY